VKKVKFWKVDFIQGDKLSRIFAMLDQNFDMTAGKAVCHTCCATWSLGTSSAFGQGTRTITEELDQIGWLQDLLDAKRLLASSSAFKETNLNIISYLCCCLTSNFLQIWLTKKVCFMHILWMSIEQKRLGNVWIPRMLIHHNAEWWWHKNSHTPAREQFVLGWSGYNRKSVSTTFRKKWVQFCRT
jgi:hypothetical protein